MKKVAYFAASLLVISSPSFAGSLQDTFNSCVSKFANQKDSVSIMLQCTAGGGKLSDCSVLDAPTPSKGFDKAALCVAEALPIGSMTGSQKVPIRFQGNS